MSNTIQKAQSAGLKSSFAMRGKDPSQVTGAIAGVSGPQQAAAINNLVQGKDSDQTKATFSGAGATAAPGGNQSQVPPQLAALLVAAAEALNLGDKGSQASDSAARTLGADGAGADQASQTMGAVPVQGHGKDGAAADQTIRPTFSNRSQGSQGGGK